ncbi:MULTISPECIES: hypothetical protein [Enterobacteriaceae]|uniref:hypothetical protein n=1 Tax=Enterobacteriaceae TaxID=543 RepID=UPI0002A20FA1|nr:MULTISPECIES: hypothetical protein [Enterobacteriaceae]ELG34828.1 hypothetical protein A1W3_03069 [Escherichia coli KTE84]MDM2800807.1 hypothetical protein [Citrobacter sp. Cpo109]HAT5066298.1 hypothetical protein [Klebsiella oxytoca]HAT5071632.1 hypothetical protein [Klebsiella oxytoca]
MSTVKNIDTVSSHFNISPSILDQLDVVDVLLESDTLLFIDPMLLPESKHPEMKVDADKKYIDTFTSIIKLLKASKVQNDNDVAWKAAKKLFSFSEIGWTCLGYGSSAKGSGFGPHLVNTTMNTAYQIINMDIDDPDLFMVMSLFEEGIGADRISDMTTNIIFESLVKFSERVNQTLQIPTKEFSFKGKKYIAPHNPLTDKPLILVPKDVVRDLPISTDWSGAVSTMKENTDLRDRINTNIGKLLASMTQKEKAEAKRRALEKKEYFEDLLELIKEVEKEPYDFKADKNGELFWSRLVSSIDKKYPFNLSKFNKKLTLDEVENLVDEILTQFKDLIENKGLWKEMWADDKKPRKEKAAQRLLFAVAYSYCKANNLDISPEADSGNGPVDFKVSQGFEQKVLVEVKLSSNGKLLHGYEKQLEIYRNGDDTDRAFFVIVDIGHLGEKYQKVQQARIAAENEGLRASKIIHIDAQQKDSASIRI